MFRLIITTRVTLCRDNFPISFAQCVSIFETKNSISANEVGAWAPGKVDNPKCIPPFWSPLSLGRRSEEYSERRAG